MRLACKYCCLKHLGQAYVLMFEAKNGYPLHKWLAVGHLAEASEEISGKSVELATQIREWRVRYMGDDEDVPIMDLIRLVEEIE